MLPFDKLRTGNFDKLRTGNFDKLRAGCSAWPKAISSELNFVQYDSQK